jgi:hypothetical protein
MAARTVNNFINGEWVPPSTSQYIDVIAPASGAAIAQVANSGAQVSRWLRDAEEKDPRMQRLPAACICAAHVAGCCAARGLASSVCFLAVHFAS